MELSVVLGHSADPRRAADEAAAPEAAGVTMPNVKPVGPEPARLIETVKSWL
ncbi:hypothetical protein [Streptomyces toxytricini]|uniref:Uncharacterized protein n=1 Tax=Streptomyces toxytricini TaxID=67369 RepID=A0ABW8EJX8_STRT5